MARGAPRAGEEPPEIAFGWGVHGLGAARASARDPTWTADVFCKQLRRCTCVILPISIEDEEALPKDA
ncbi:MAG TPA: hypothetical protein VFU93_03480 [Acidimicrobiales bacterium]|nr:hypothetical protein [Acidimicrobiales bacterium]